MPSPGSTRSLAPAAGVTPPPTDGASYRFLSDVILAHGLVEPVVMKSALQASLDGRSLTAAMMTLCSSRLSARAAWRHEWC